MELTRSTWSFPSVREERIKPGLALDDGGAVHFRGTRPWRVIALNGVIGVRTVRLDKTDGTIVEEPMPLERIEL